MCRVAVERFATASSASLVLADINTSALEAKVPYLDFDDVESTRAALDLHERAKKEGVPCYIGCGASPGMTNVMAVDVARGLDSVDALDVFCLVGGERPDIGKAVLEHLMHIAAGPCLTWANGKPTVNETWVETGYAPMLGDSGETLLHETAHPEPVTLPRLFAKTSRIRWLGSLAPAPFNGIARGLGDAVRRQALSIDDAVGFLHHLVNNPPLTAGWGGAFQVPWRRHCCQGGGPACRARDPVACAVALCSDGDD